MKNIKLNLIFIFYGLLLVLPTNANENEIKNKITNELVRYYKNFKTNILGNNVGDYEFYFDYIKKERDNIDKICPTVDIFSNQEVVKPQLTGYAIDYLYNMKIMIPYGYDDAVMNGLCGVVEHIQYEFEKCEIILMVFSNRRGDTHSTYIKEHVDRIKAIDTEEAELDLAGDIGDVLLDRIDRKVLIDVYESTLLKSNAFSFCENGIYQVEGEVLTISMVLSELNNKCNGQEIKNINIFGFSEIKFDKNIPSNLAKYVTIVAPKLTKAAYVNAAFDLSNTNTFAALLHIADRSDGDVYISYMQEKLNFKDTNFHSFKYSGDRTPYDGESKEEHYQNLLLTLNEYKKKLIQSLKYVNVGNKITLLNIINSLKILNRHSDTTIIYEDVLNLINGNIKLTRNNPKFNGIYQAMLDRIVTKAETLKPGASDERKLLNFMYSAVASKLISLSDSLDRTFVFGISNYIKAVQRNIKLLDSIHYIKSISKMSSDYKNGIMSKINEGKRFIENNIGPEINKIQNNIIQEVQKMIGEANVKKGELEHDKTVIKKHIAQSLFSGFLNVVGTILAIVGGPVGVAVGGALTAGSSALKSISMGEMTGSVPPELDYSINELDSFIKKHDKADEIIDKMLAIPEIQSDTSFNVTKLALLGFKTSKMAAPKLSFVKDYVNKTITILKNSTDPVDMKKLETFKKLETAVNVGIGTVAVGAEVFTTVAEVSSLNDALNQKNKQIESLNKFSDLITDRLVPFLHRVKTKLEKDKENLKNAAPISLDIKEWQISEFLSNIRGQLSAISFGFQAQKEIIAQAQKLDKYFEFLIKIYQRIQSYEEHKQFADYITSIQNPNKKMANSIFEKARLELDSIIKKDVIIKNYNNLFDSVRLYAFPFEDLFLSGLSEDVYDNETDVKELIESTYNNLETLDLNIEYIQNKGMPELHAILKDEWFNKTIPFTKWKYSDNKIAFNNLLSGEPILLTAVQPKEVQNDVLKLIAINFLIQSTDPDETKGLNIALENITVEFTHMGDSHYKCDDKEFIIESTSYKMACDYGKNAETCSSCCTKSAILYKDSGYPQLSPYGTYGIRLKPRTNYKDNFENIKTYAGENIYMTLEGYAQYITDTSDNVCNKPQYYENFRIILK